MSLRLKTNKSKTIKASNISKNSTRKRRTSVIQTVRRENDDTTPVVFSQFRIADEQINNFKRLLPQPKDCFINAMQIMGMIDVLGGNMLRISCAGSHGFTKEQIELIFTLHTEHRYDFVHVNYQVFVNTINTELQPGFVTLGGYQGHVFIIGRYLDGTIVYIDPQVNAICNLMDPECEKYLKVSNTYYLLLHSVKQLSEKQLKALGFQF